MKIKTKKQLNLPQLIEWAMENDIKHRVFESNPNFDGVTYKLGFDKGGDLYFEEALSPTLLFTVEVEEEITEDTVFEFLLEVRDGGTFIPYYNESIKSQVDKIVKEYHTYIDGEFKLIWRDGKLVE